MRLQQPCIAIGVLGSGGPVLVIFAVHWANGGLGQFALAYAWPLWFEVWYCVGHWLFVAVLLLWYASMQRELAWMALKQLSTLWIIAVTGVHLVGLISLYEFGVRRSTWISLPSYIVLALVFPFVTMVDTLPPKLRLPGLRLFGSIGLGAVAMSAVVLRLPTAESTPGELVWTVMGTDTVTNLQAITYSATVLVLLLAEGVMKALVFPNELAFIEMPLRFTELAAGAHAPVRLRAVASARSSVAPHPLDPSSESLA
jgi:hypothetical protein